MQLEEGLVCVAQYNVGCLILPVAFRACSFANMNKMARFGKHAVYMCVCVYDRGAELHPTLEGGALHMCDSACATREACA